MIWLIGNKGMLGTEVEALLKKKELACIASDQEIDITNRAALQEFSTGKPITWIINCAAYTAVDKAEDEPDLAFKLNADGPLNIAVIAKTKKAKLIHISTDYVFDGTKEGDYTEDDNPNPINVYGKSKYQGEQNIQGILKEYFIIRTSWLYGHNGSNFVKTMLRLFQEKPQIRVVDDQWGSPTYAHDLAVLISQIIDQRSTAYGIYQFTNEGRINWYQFACAIYNQAQKHNLLNHHVEILPIDTAHYPTMAKRPSNSYLSKGKLLNTFNTDLQPWEMSLSTYIKNDK